MLKTDHRIRKPFYEGKNAKVSAKSRSRKIRNAEERSKACYFVKHIIPSRLNRAQEFSINLIKDHWSLLSWVIACKSCRCVVIRFSSQ